MVKKKMRSFGKISKGARVSALYHMQHDTVAGEMNCAFVLQWSTLVENSCPPKDKITRGLLIFSPDLQNQATLSQSFRSIAISQARVPCPNFQLYMRRELRYIAHG